MTWKYIHIMSRLIDACKTYKKFVFTFFSHFDTFRSRKLLHISIMECLIRIGEKRLIMLKIVGLLLVYILQHY